MKHRLLVLISCAAACCLAQMPPALVSVEKATERVPLEVRRYTGRVESPSVVQVVTRVSGEIIKVGFQDGDMVKKGQVLYQLDPVQYYATMKACEARVAQGKAQIEQCLAKETYAKNNHERNASLFQKTVISRDAFELAKSEMEAAYAATQAARAALQEAEAQLIQAQDDYKNTTIVAPIDGKVGVSVKTLGNYITPSSGVLVTLIQTDPMRVRFSVSLRDYLDYVNDAGEFSATPRIEIHQANGSVYPQNGKLDLVDNQANRSTDTVPLYASVANGENLLFHESTVSVYLHFTGAKKQVVVSPSCIMHDIKGAYLYVVDGESRVTRRDVKLGLTTNQLQFLESGVQVGETVICDGMHKTMPGAVVQTVEKAAN